MVILVLNCHAYKSSAVDHILNSVPYKYIIINNEKH